MENAKTNIIKFVKSFNLLFFIDILLYEAQN